MHWPEHVYHVDFGFRCPPVPAGVDMPEQESLACALHAPGTRPPLTSREPHRDQIARRTTSRDGEMREFHAGSVVLLDDATGKGHVTKMVGNAEVQLMFVQVPATTDAGAGRPNC